MFDQKLLLAIGSLKVVSELEYDASHPDRTVVRIVDACGGHRREHLDHEIRV